MTCRSCGTNLPDGARFCPSCGAPSAPQTDERRIVTVLFADVVGFTGLAEGVDPERIKNTLSAWLERLAAEVEAHGGRVDKVLGDAIVALFGAPLAHEDDAERAVRAGLAMQRAAETQENGLKIRVGINTGEAVIGSIRAGDDLTAMGDVVNVAQRLQVTADPGSVLVGPQTYEATSDTIRYSARGPLHARGREATVEAWEAVAALGPPGYRPRRMKVPLVGRKAELGHLWHILGTAAEAHRPHLVLLLGEAGVGKTRLVEEALDVARRQHDALTLEGRCVPYGEANPWWPVAEALRQVFSITPTDPAEDAIAKCRTTVSALVGENGARVSDGLLYLMGYEGPLGDLEPARARDEAARALQDAVRALARTRPLVMVLSELHWADDLVLDLIDRTFERLRDVGAVLLATARPELQERWTPRAGRSNLLVLNLDPLDRESSRRLVRHLLGTEPGAEALDDILDRAGGNPLFMTELAALLDEARGPTSLPATLRGLVAARLDALDPAVRAAVEDAAVVGRSGSIAALTAMLTARGAADPDTDIDNLSQTDLVVLRDGAFSFTSDVLRDVAYETLTKAERARRHARLGDWLAAQAERTARDAEYLERVAHHLATAAELQGELGMVEGLPDLRERALRWLHRAAARAADRETAPAAARLYDRALSLYSGEPGVAHRALVLGRAAARFRLRDLRGATADATDALQSARAEGDAAHIGRALTILGEIHRAEHKPDVAIEELDEAIRAWRDAGDASGEAEALRAYGLSKMDLGDLASADESVSRALEVSRSLGDRRGEAWALQNLAWVAFTRGEQDVAEERLLASQNMFAEIGDFAGEGWAVGLLGYVRYLKGDLEFAEGVAEAGIDLTKETGDRWAHGMMINLLALVRLWQGRTLDAERLGRKAHGVLTELDDPIAALQSLVPVAWSLVLTGRADEAKALLGERLPDAGTTQSGLALIVASHLCSQAGDGEAAVGYATQALEIDDSFTEAGSLALGLGHLISGRPAEALKVLDEVRPEIHAAGDVANLNCLTALALAAAGRPERAVEMADSILPDLGSYLDRVRARIARGLALARLGDGLGSEREFRQVAEAVDATDDLVNQALVRLAHATALVAQGAETAATKKAEALARLEPLDVCQTAWEAVFALGAGLTPAPA